ncbi:hypothetical protein XBKQ1_2370006 [Xenorhabdus bovienii str. kraussei Quebec]|uniref:Uncharacterized protein n=1 Tax=Xenorhabdus bovienii str. kraussei Quebec TaxID=1398203 RepID=A0A077PFK3_XENBV|nr:hypothetical protein XBKQ1_2370006 [Xenorhabdus bovienii str. kraussei Quebec]
MIKFIDETISNYHFMKEKEKINNLYYLFIPLPDKFKSGKILWLLSYIRHSAPHSGIPPSYSLLYQSGL